MAPLNQCPSENGISPDGLSFLPTVELCNTILWNQYCSFIPARARVTVVPVYLKSVRRGEGAQRTNTRLTLHPQTTSVFQFVNHPLFTCKLSPDIPISEEWLAPSGLSHSCLVGLRSLSFCYQSLFVLLSGPGMGSSMRCNWRRDEGRQNVFTRWSRKKTSSETHKPVFKIFHRYVPFHYQYLTLESIR